MRGTWWHLYVVVGLLVALVYPFLAAGVGQDVVYVALGASCVVAIAVGVRGNRPARRAAWYLMALGQLLWVIGDAVDSWYQDVRHDVPFPSVADAFYLSAYPVLAIGLFLLIRGRRPRRDGAGLLDSAIVTAGLGVLSWVMIAGPTIRASSESVSAAAVGVAYPVADIVLVGLLIRLVTTPGGRTASLRLLLLAVGLLVAGDTTSAALNLFTSGGDRAYDVIWLVSYVAWGAAALHPSMRSLSEPTRGADSGFTLPRLAVLSVATLIAPLTLVVQHWLGVPLDVWPVVIASIVLFLLVVARMYVAIRQIVAANRAREQLQTALAYQAAHDSLTALPNRAEALRLIESALHRAQRTGAMIGLLFIDLDGFKGVNDSLGHRAGDEVLRVIARRMQKNVRGGDVVARLGGDEFVVLLEPVDTESSAVSVAHRLVEVAAEPITAGGQDVRVGASIGVAISQDGLTDADRVLHEADTAVYRAKAAGRGRVEVFDTALRHELDEQAELDLALSRAVRDDELVVHYQPVVDLRSGVVQGFEALVRWQRPDVGLVLPGTFVPAAEHSALICEVGTWVLRHATAQLAQWNKHGSAGRSLTVAVKISGRHLAEKRVLDDVALALAESGLPAAQLIVEVTETILTDDLLAIAHLDELRKTGVVVAIDHFGTGYNSIARLQNLPIDIIKIDRGFVDTVDPTSRRLLELLVHAGHAFGLPVIAEGVEHEHQIGELRSFGCEAAQGFYFARPMPASEAGPFIEQSSLIAPPAAGSEPPSRLPWST